METNITDQAYFQKWMGYDVVCLKASTMADVYAQVTVVMIVWYLPQGGIIESTRFHRPNSVIFKVVTNKWTPLIGA